MVTYRELALDELARIGEIDRSERVTHAYVQVGSKITLRGVDLNVPTWALEGEGPHTVAAKVAAWQAVAAEGRAFGAFDGERLVGVGILRDRLEGEMAELAVLHVDCAHREQGIGKHLATMVCDAARATGATSIYVSASDAERAVRFYLSLGFSPTATPHPARLADEPEDIHMTMVL